MPAFGIGVDLGGTKIAAAAVTADGQILSRMRFPVDKQNTLLQIEQVVHDVVAAAEASWEDTAGIGLIVPGIYFAASGEVWAPNLFGQERIPLGRELQARFPAAVTLDSDRAGYVLGEHWLGAARGLRNVVFLAAGTGIGAGILVDGRLCRGAGDIAGAVGWFALKPDKQPIYREVGCWEAEAAGPALARRLAMESAECVAAAARRGDPAALQAIQETARYLGMGVANIVSLLNPEMIVLGGGLMQAADLLLDPLRCEMLAWAQPLAARQVRLELSQLGEDAGVLGAARLALQGKDHVG